MSQMKTSHLHYHSLEAWAEDLPGNWSTYPDMAKRALWYAQYAELKQHLWNQHLATLSFAEQRELKEGTHPSQSHRYEERAQPFLQLLADELAQRGCTAKVRVGIYHMDRIVLSVALDQMPASGLRNLPWLFRGFEVKYGFPGMVNPTEPSLTAQPSPTSRNLALAAAHFIFGGLWLPLGPLIAYTVTPLVGFAPQRRMIEETTLLEEPAWNPLFVGTFAALPALFLVVSGVCILQSRCRSFSLVVAWLSCLIFPIGTAFGVWTLLSLRRRDWTS